MFTIARKRALFIILVGLIAAGCSPGTAPVQPAAETSLPLDQPIRQDILPTATPTSQPPPDPTPTIPTLPQGPGAEWQLVIIGDSSLWGLGEALAEQIEKDQGVKVIVYDVSLGGLSAGRVLKVLEGGKDPNLKLKELRKYLAEAEMVVMWTNPNDSSDPNFPFEVDGCFSYRAPGEYSTKGLEKFTVDLQSIWVKILELRQGQPVILRAMDLYNPLVAPWQQAGVFEECTECWEIMSASARQAAEASGIPFLSRLDAFNGSEHNEDPSAKGLIAEDGEHPSLLASQLTAQLLAEMGYEPTIPVQFAP
jgi:hypothetical protein